MCYMYTAYGLSGRVCYQLHESETEQHKLEVYIYILEKSLR